MDQVSRHLHSPTPAHPPETTAGQRGCFVRVIVVTVSADAPGTTGHQVADAAPAIPWWRRRWTVAGRELPSPLALGLGALAAALAVLLLYNVARRSIAAESDMATVALEARSVLGGHLLLGGWRMLYDSFWTVEVPFYVVGVLIAGVSPVLLYVIPAVIAVLLLVTAALMARQGRRGGAAVAAVATVLAVIGLPSNVWAILLLHTGWHIATMLWCLIAFAALRSGRWGVGWWVAVLFLTAGMLGDLQTLALGLGPVALAGMIASARTRRWLSGAPAAQCGGRRVLRMVGDPHRGDRGGRLPDRWHQPPCHHRADAPERRRDPGLARPGIRRRQRRLGQHGCATGARPVPLPGARSGGDRRRARPRLDPGRHPHRESGPARHRPVMAPGRPARPGVRGRSGVLRLRRAEQRPAVCPLSLTVRGLRRHPRRSHRRPGGGTAASPGRSVGDSPSPASR